MALLPSKLLRRVRSDVGNYSDNNGSGDMTELSLISDEASGGIYDQSSFYCACIMVGLCVFGIFGNLLSLFVFSQRTMRGSSINVLLLGLSLTDCLLLLIVVPIFALPPLSNTKTASPSLLDFMHYVIVYFYPVALTLQTSSVWIFILITVERFMAVCFPLEVGVYCTVRRSQIGLMSAFLMAFMYNLVRFWEYETVPCPQSINQTACGSIIALPKLRLVRTYWFWYATVLYLITQFLVPFVIITVLNSMVIYRMYQARKQRALLSVSEKTEHKTALMMIIVVVVFACCYTLSFVLNIMESLDPDFFYRPTTAKIAFLINDISNTLVVFNSAFTSVIYFCFSYRYRQIAKITLLRCIPCAKLQRYISKDVYNQTVQRKSFITCSVMRDGTKLDHRPARTHSAYVEQPLNRSNAVIRYRSEKREKYHPLPNGVKIEPPRGAPRTSQDVMSPQSTSTNLLEVSPVPARPNLRRQSLKNLASAEETELKSLLPTNSTAHLEDGYGIRNAPVVVRFSFEEPSTICDIQSHPVAMLNTEKMSDAE